MKILLILTFYFNFSYSDLIVKTTYSNLSYCVSDNYDTNFLVHIFYLKSDNSMFTAYHKDVLEILPNYKYDSKTGKCESISDINKEDTTDKFLGMTEQDYNFAMAIYGVALSSLIGFGLVRSIS